VILVLALLPTAFLLAGLLRGAAEVATTACGRASQTRETLGKELLVIVAVGFIAFIVVYTLRYRDFSTMKAEFLFPGLLAYVFLFVEEVGRAVTRYSRHPRLRHVAGFLFAVLLVLYVTDVLMLAVHLT
jgi:hypothetical protein